MKYAVVDLGSNTIRLSLYNSLGSGEFELLFSEKEMAGLVNYISQDVLSDEGIEEACSVLKKFRSLLSQFNVDEMHVFATASLRNIKNTEQTVQKIKESTGIEVDVISGETEALYGYSGALLNCDHNIGAMFDIGGGSTEIIKIDSGKITEAESVKIGSLNLFNQFVSKIWPDKSELNDIKLKIEETFVKEKKHKSNTVCGVGGTARAVLKIANRFYGKNSQNRMMSMEELKEITDILTEKKKSARKLILKSCPDRIHTIIPGTLIMHSICSIFCEKEIYISKYGVREGYLCHKLLKDKI